MRAGGAARCVAGLEKEIMTEYLPVIPRYYSGVAHGSRIEDPGHRNDSTTRGHADLQGHLGLQQ